MLDFIILLALLIAGYVFGELAERRHYRSILAREEELRSLLLIPVRTPPESALPPATVLVAGCAVISVDFFKVFVAGLRSLIGGRLTSYESLVDRARREAVLRMKEDARRRGANMIVNVKFEAVPLYKGARSSVQSVEALVYGTALISQRSEGG